MLIVDEDVPIAVFVQALFFCRLQQHIEIAVVRRWRRAGREKEEKKRYNDKKKVYGTKCPVYHGNQECCKAHD
jgi:hypothetical protein